MKKVYRNQNSVIYLCQQNEIIMTNQEILAKANEIVKGANFTKIMKVRKNAGPAFLIVAFGNGNGLYRSYTSDTVYASLNNQMVRLA